MKLTTGILAMAMMVSGSAATVVAQNTDAIDNARSIAKSLQQKQANDTNAALDAAGVPPTAKPAPGAPAPAVKPAVIPGANPASAAVAPAPKAAVASAPKASSASSQHNQLQQVNVEQGSDTIQIEINSSQAVTPRVSKLSSPARVVVELPETTVASSQNRIPVGSAGVKAVRIGMDGKTPPTTSIVVDLEKALAFDLTGSGEKLVLTLHTQGDTQSAEKTVAKATAPAGQPKTVAAKSAPVAKSQPAAKPAESKIAATKPVSAKTAAKPAEKEQAVKTVAPAQSAPGSQVSKIGENSKPKQEDKKWAMNGKRDPFFSPVVQQNGSGCSTGKKCLEIGNINLRGVVKSDSGFIAVVTNNLNKAYFLRENDPVFNGYVVRITGDSVVFQETVQDKLGKPFTREVVKRIFTPAV
ncbi:MAG TPA: AMIN domain-containing protein [Candidatus Sulfotelmatobacter sp.]|nr:AMIN domain-containing protein [Candidatus Sulfotelmatobacter sp.]